MIWRCYLWLIIPCFIINATLNFKSRYALSQNPQLIHANATLTSTGALQELDNATFIQFLLQEYSRLIKDFPKTEKSKTSQRHKLKATFANPALKKKTGLLAEVIYTSYSTKSFYKPQNFHLSDYYNYLFRLTPF